MQERHEGTKARRAFTIVEIVVVISLILFLLGLTLSVSTVVIERSEIRQTEITIRLLDTALQEWEALADRQITWGRDTFPSSGSTYDLQGNWLTGRSLITDDVFIISELLDVIGRSSQVKDIIARIDADFVHTYEPGSPYPPWIDPAQENAVDSKWGVQHGPLKLPPSLAILDAWDAPIYPIHPGPLWEDMGISSMIRDEDSTARITNETKYGIARNRRICFLSAGPDGHFGLDEEFLGLGGDDLARAKEKARADNLYSYQPEFTDAP